MAIGTIGGVDALSLLILFGVTVVIGYIGSSIFHKTRIPDVIWLIFFGILIGPVLGLIQRDLFVAVTPLLSALALLIILFDAGLNINFYRLVRVVPRSFMLAALGMLLGMVVVGIASVFLFNFNLMYGLLLGAIIGGTSSPIVLSMVEKMKISPIVKDTLTLESVITDPLTIIVAIALIDIIMQTNPVVNPIQGILGSFSIGAMIGLITGLIWLFVLHELKGKPFDYMLTLAFVFLLYAFVETSGGSGAIAALAFGIVLGNGLDFSKMLKLRKQFSIDMAMKTFQSEISFFVRSFFFVYLGLIVLITPTYLLYGIIISAILVIIRLLSVGISTVKMKATSLEKKLMLTMGPRGLAAAVLAQLPLVYGMQNAEIFSGIAFTVILATVIYSAIATFIFYRPDRVEKEKKQMATKARARAKRKKIQVAKRVKARKIKSRKLARRKPKRKPIPKRKTKSAKPKVPQTKVHDKFPVRPT